MMKRLTAAIAIALFAMSTLFATPAYAAGSMPTASVSPCGWGMCIWFDANDQRALMAGGGVALVAGLCKIGVPCLIAGITVAAATSYLMDNGVCRRGLGLRIAGGNKIFCRR